MMHMNRKRPQVFYGWWIVAAGFITWVLTGGFIILGFTAFFEPIANDFGWSYTQVSIAAALRGVEVGLLAPLVGLVVDRWGPRKLMFAGFLLIGFALIFLSRINSLGMFYVGFAVAAIGISGSSPTVVFTAIANWFHKKLGIATAVAASGFALGGLIVPLVVKLIDVYDWRTALLILGITTLAVCLPCSLLVRHKPEQYGYLPDGEPSIVTAPEQVPVPAETRDADFGIKQALRSRPFWHLVLAMMLLYIGISTMVAHVMPYLGSVGVQRSTAGLVAMAVPLVSIAGRLASGWFGDRFNKKQVATVFFATLALGLLCLSYASSEAMWIIIPFIILFGTGWGGNVTLRVSMLREYFGRSKFGSIFGFMMGMQALGGIIGPLFAGWVFDSWGDYQIAWLTLTVIVFIGMIMIATIPPVTTNVQQADNR